MEKQYIIFPWQAKKWFELRDKLAEPINSIVDLDSRLATMYGGQVKSRDTIELFNIYYTSDDFIKDRIPQEHLLKNIIPMMQKLIIEAPKIFKGFWPRVLVPNPQPKNLVILRPQVAALLSCAFFGLFSGNYIGRGALKPDNFSTLTFQYVFTSRNIFALQCLLNYFDRVFQYLTAKDSSVTDAFGAGNIMIYRKSLPTPPSWEKLGGPICQICIGEDESGQPGRIDDSPAHMHVDFANDYLGGNMFDGMLTYEEILFLVRPECLVAVLFCSRLMPDESICIFGAEKMSQYLGYASNVKFIGNYNDPCSHGYSPDATEVMLQHVLICIDATPKTGGVAQFIDDFERDLNKAYCGFSAPPTAGGDIATGNWNCGAFGGNMHLKFIQQVLAASLANRTLIYYPTVRDFEEKLVQFVEWLQSEKLTIGQFYLIYKQIIRKYHNNNNSRLNDLDLFDCFITSKWSN